MNNGDISKNTIAPKLTDEDKLNEYINLLLNDDNFEIKTDEQEKSWSNGKKIGTFFGEYHREITERFFNEIQKGKTKEFKARAKIIDYMMSIGEKKIKKIEDSYERVLEYLNDYSNIEDIVRCVSVSMSSDGTEKYNSAMIEYLKAYNYDEENSEDYLETYMNNSGMSFAMSSEKIFKALIIFSECLRSKRYTYAPSNYSEVIANNNGDKNLIIGTSKWRRELNKKGEYGAIRSEASLLELVKENITLPTLDKRASIDSVKSTSGHDLYSLYQLLDPVSKLIVNSEFYIYDPKNPDNRDKGIGMYAVLTQKLDYQQAGTADVIQNLEEYSDDFVKSRYADIDLNNVQPDELDFLKRISTALKDYCTYRFPIGKKYDRMDFSNVDMNYFDSTIENGNYSIAKYPYFCKLDKVSKYYLLSNFDRNEIECLNQYLNQLQSKNFDYIQIEQFLNLAIFFKQFVVDNLKMNLSFEEIVLDNLTQYFNNIKDFDLFNGVSNNLFLNSFFTKENVERLQKEIEKFRKEKKLNPSEKFLSEIKHVDPVELKISSFINLLNQEINEGRELSVFSSKSDMRFEDGTRVNSFWMRNAKQIKSRLLEEYKELKNKKELTPEENEKLLGVFRAINAIGKHRFVSNVDAQIKSFIETISKEIPDIGNDRQSIFSIMRDSKKYPIYFEGHSDVEVSPHFWTVNYKRIIAKLFVDEEYKDVKYDKARDLVKTVCQRNGMILPEYTRPISYTNGIINNNSSIENNLIDKNYEINNYINNNIYNYNDKIINNPKKF